MGPRFREELMVRRLSSGLKPTRRSH